MEKLVETPRGLKSCGNKVGASSYYRLGLSEGHAPGSRISTGGDHALKGQGKTSIDVVRKYRSYNRSERGKKKKRRSMKESICRRKTGSAESTSRGSEGEASQSEQSRLACLGHKQP